MKTMFVKCKYNVKVELLKGCNTYIIKFNNTVWYYDINTIRLIVILLWFNVNNTTNTTQYLIIIIL